MGTVISIKPQTSSSRVTYYPGTKPGLDQVGVESNPDTMAGLIARVDAFWKSCSGSGPAVRLVLRDKICKNAVAVTYAVQEQAGMLVVGKICGANGGDIKNKFFNLKHDNPPDSAYMLYATSPTTPPDEPPPPPPPPEPPTGGSSKCVFTATVEEELLVIEASNACGCIAEKTRCKNYAKKLIEAGRYKVTT